MCGRITLLTYEELLDVVESVEKRTAAGLLREQDGATRAQARPNSVVRAITPVGGQLEISELVWGFPLDGGKKTVFNTRIESALEGSRMWLGPLRDGRCLLPVASFFEPHATETSISPRTGRPIKRQYEFASESGMPLLLASVHDGTRLSVVTSEPNASVAPIHPRMPLVLRFEEVEAWLYGDYATLADRSGISLAARPETPEPPAPAQLSLFS